MDKLDLKGIVWIPARNKYRVLLTRKGIEYVIGYYVERDDAIVARDAFLENYNANYGKSEFSSVYGVTKYSKEWFRLEHEKNLRTFSDKYNKKDAPKYIVLSADTEWISTPLKKQVL